MDITVLDILEKVQMSYYFFKFFEFSVNPSYKLDYISSVVQHFINKNTFCYYSVSKQIIHNKIWLLYGF